MVNDIEQCNERVILDPNLFIHPSDKAAMAALQAIPGFAQVMKAFMKVWDEKTAKILNMSTHLKLSENQMKKYYDMLPPICEKLGIEVPELYVELDVNPNAYTWGDTKPYIVITSGLFETLPDELIPSVIAHECGHIACHHPLYTTMGNAILQGASYFVSGLGNIALYPVQLAFAYWMRCSELSADRAAAICDGSAEHVIETMMRFAGYDKDIMAEANVDVFMEQANEYRAMVKEDAWNKALEFIMFKDKSHPMNAVRALEIHEWENTDRFRIIQQYLTSPESTVLPTRIRRNKCIDNTVEDAVKYLSDNGFTNIDTTRVSEIEGKAKERGVVKIEVDGQEMLEDDYFLSEAAISLTYYESKTEEEIALEHPAEIKMNEASKAFLGKHIDAVVKAVTDMGFSNIVLKEMAMPKIGLFAKIDTVAKILIDGDDQFEKDSWHEPNAKVTIYYYVKL